MLPQDTHCSDTAGANLKRKEKQGGLRSQVSGTACIPGTLEHRRSGVHALGDGVIPVSETHTPSS